MPSTLGQFNGDDKPKLTKEQKKKLLEMVAAFNNYGKVFDKMDELVTTANALEEIANMAETFSVNESGEWFSANKVIKDFADVKKRTAEFKKYSKECYTRMQEMAALYEDVGHVLKRYYQIQDLTPDMPKTAPDHEESHPEIKEDDSVQQAFDDDSFTGTPKF
jgi:cell fate (sporulation/competence/biofilm development) regulator YlbF (YheA/YmcA/DUF963 family)